MKKENGIKPERDRIKSLFELIADTHFIWFTMK